MYQIETGIPIPPPDPRSLFGHSPLPPIEYLRSMFRYDPETGDLRELTGEIVKAYKVGRNEEYKRFRIGTKMYLVHRVCFAIHTGVDPGELVVDHIDRDPNNNKASNLRAVRHEENAQNSKYGFFYKMCIGESHFLPTPVNYPSIRARASQLKSLSGLHFKIRSVDGGIRVWRLA